jgi:NitT/TauT family transport system substrate-binding protein
MKTIRLICEEHLTYVPHHVAEHLGLFARQGLTIETNYDSGPGGSWLADLLAEGRADIARGGVWIPLMYRGRLEQIRIFAQLCGRNTQMLIAREPHSNFQWSDLYGKKLLMPASSTSQWMFLKGVLLEAGIDITRIRFIRDLDESTTTRLWRAGFTDYYLTYPPLGDALLQEGYNMATDLAVSAKPVPWSVYYTSPGYLNANREPLGKFVAALSDAAAWMEQHSAVETAKLIAADFPTVSLDVMTRSIERMSSVGTWSPNMTVRPEPFARYQGFIRDYGLIESVVPYDDIIEVMKTGDRAEANR